MDNLSELEQAERELESKLAEIRSKKAIVLAAPALVQTEEVLETAVIPPKAIEAPLAPIPVTFKVIKFDDKKYHVHLTVSNRRADCDDIRVSTPGSFYSTNNKEIIIPIQNWVDYRARVQALPATKFEYVNGVVKQIAEALEASDYQVSLSEGKLIIKLTPWASPYYIERIPGAKYDRFLYAVTLPLVEGYRLWDVLAKEAKVSWTEPAKTATLNEIKKRSELDSIALSNDAPDYDVELASGDKLRPFQRVGVKFLDTANGKAILADQMGLGKTIQLIAYALKNKKRLVVICPASLKENWRREIERFTGIKPYSFKGTEPGIFDIQRLLQDKPQFAIFHYDMLSRTKETFQTIKRPDGTEYRTNITKRWLWIDVLNSAGFDIVGIDEAHYIKNSGSGRSVAVRQLTIPKIVFLTGTPVLNRPGELWPLLTMLQPEQFASETNFLSRYTWNGREAKNVDELKSVLKTMMIRRLKKDVIKELPPLQRIYEWHELGEGARALYNKALAGVYEQLAAWDPISAGNEKEIPNLLAQIMRLKQICAMDKLETVADMAVDMYDSAEGQNRKVLIFTQFEAIARGIAARLGGESLCMTGANNASERQSIVDKFQNDEKVHFLAMTWQVGGEGLNLTAASYVIFNDLFWTPASHQQCEERCYGRIKDMHGATSYYVVAEDSIDQWIQEILSKKLALIEAVVDGVQSDRNANIGKELLARMRSEMFKARKG